MVRVQVRLTKGQYEALQKLAHGSDMSMSEIVRQSIDRMVSTAAAVDPEERKRRVLSLASRFHSGKSDISLQHDKHLTEGFED